MPAVNNSMTMAEMALSQRV